MPPPTVSVVVPTYNERDNLAPLIDRLRRTYEHNPPPTLIVVDDNSPDGTAAHARALSREYPIEVVVRATERGLASAVIAGLARATSDIVIVMDADLSHPPERIPALVDALRDPAVNMAIGSRFVPGGSVDLDWPLHRRVVSLIGRWLAAPLAPRGVRDIASGFFAVRRADLQLNRLRPIGYKIALELIVRHRWNNVAESPIRFSDRRAGQTKLNLAEHSRYLRHLARLYWYVLTRPAARR